MSVAVYETVGRRAWELIAKADRVLVVTHIAPDGDAIGSLLALGQMLRQLGKTDVTLSCDDGVPDKLAFLPGATAVVTSVSDSFDLVIVVDCSDEGRGGGVFRAAMGGRPLVINIDHHITNTEFGDVSIVRPDTAATTEILFLLAAAWGVTLDKDTAQCLLTGLVTDTLCFRTAHATAGVMRVATDLMQAGADLAYITSRTVNRRSYDAIRYWGMLLQSIDLDDRVISVCASANDHPVSGDARVASFLITAEEADMAVSFVETEDGQVEVSLRAKPGFDVAQVAFKLRGGGHSAAAGCTVDGSLDQVVDQVLAMMKKARREQARA